MTNITYSSKDQNWNEGKTNYWFDVDGESFAISDHDGELSLLDGDGVEMHDNFPEIKSALIAQYVKHIND